MPNPAMNIIRRLGTKSGKPKPKSKPKKAKAKIKFPEGVKDQYGFNQYLHMKKWDAEANHPYGSKERKAAGKAAVKKELKKAGAKQGYFKGL